MRQLTLAFVAGLALSFLLFSLPFCTQPAQVSTVNKKLEPFEIATWLVDSAGQMENVNLDAVQVLLRQAIHLCEKVPSEQRDSAFWFALLGSRARLAELLSMKGATERNEALAILDTALQEGRSFQSFNQALVKPLLSKGGLIWRENLDSAFALFDEAEKILKAKNLVASKWMVDVHLKKTYTFLGLLRFDSASVRLQKIWAQKASLSKSQLSDAHIYQGRLFRESKISLDSAKAYFFKAVQLNEDSTGNQLQLMWACYQMSGVAYYMDDFENFLVYMIRACAIAKRLYPSPSPVLAFMCEKAGAAYSEAADFDEAVSLYEEALSIHEKLEGKRPPDLLMNFGVCMDYKEEHEKAVLLLDEALQQYRIDANIIGQIQTHINFGIACMNLSDYSKSEAHHRAALQLLRENFEEETEFHADCYFNLAQLFNAQALYIEAARYLDTCAQIRQRLSITDGVIISNQHYHYAESHLGRQMLQPALHHFQKSIAALVPSCTAENIAAFPHLDSTILSRMQLLYPLEGKARALHEIYRQSSSQEDCQLASAAFASTSDLITKIRLSFRSEGSKYELMELARQVYENAIRHAAFAWQQTQSPRYLDEMFGHMEKSKAVVLSEALWEKRVKFDNIPQEWLDREARLRTEIAEAEKALLSERSNEQGGNRATIAQLTTETLPGLKKALAAFRDSLEKSFPKYAALHYETKTPGLENIRQWLRQPVQANTAVIEYFLGDSTLAAVGISAEKTVCRFRRVDEKFHRQLDSLISMVSTQPNAGTNDLPAFSSLSRSLGSALLDTLLSQLKAERLVLIPDGKLGFLPFHALLTREAAPAQKGYRSLPYLWKSHCVRYEFSARFLLDSLVRRAPYPLTYAGFAPTYFHLPQQKKSVAVSSIKHLQPLDSAGRIVQKGAQIFSGSQFIGPAVSKRQFFETATGGATILHFAMHALLEAEQPMNARLIFSNFTTAGSDTALHAYELYSREIHADLAVLGACRTGSGDLKQGEGILSLARAFKFAGCQNVVMTLWEAGDFSSAKLTRYFFENLKKGERKDTALNAAMRSYLTKDKAVNGEFLHPFYWSHFVLVGDGEPLNLKRSVGWRWWLAGLAAVGIAAGVGFMMLRKRRRIS